MNYLGATVVDKVEFIKKQCRDQRVLDLGCVRHDAEFSLSDPNWLHRHIQDVADSVVGVDYIESEVSKLNKISGYSIIYGDVTKPLPIEQKFDVIVAGDLIEHLSCFEGFFININRLLKDDGILILTTPNPFYRDGFFFTALKNNVLVNPEHTCWIDPICLGHLTQRFFLDIREMYWLNGSNWKLSKLIAMNESNKYDILKGKWAKDSLRDKIQRRLLGYVFELFYYPLKLLISRDSVAFADYLVVIQKRQEIIDIP